MGQDGFSKIERDLGILEHVEDNPDTTQASIAIQLELAVGTVNWYLRRLIAKGHIKVRRMRGRRVRYLLTPQGIAEKARLTASYLQVSMRLYNQTRTEAKLLLAQLKRLGYGRVRIEGDGELADICRLTCLEQGVKVEQGAIDGSLPVLHVDGMSLSLDPPEDGGVRLQ